MGRGIKSLRWEGKWQGVPVANDLDTTMHQQFIDDIILFGVASRKETRTIKNYLDDYCLESGQSINWINSEVFFSIRNQAFNEIWQGYWA